MYCTVRMQLGLSMSGLTCWEGLVAELSSRSIYCAVGLCVALWECGWVVGVRVVSVECPLLFQVVEVLFYVELSGYGLFGWSLHCFIVIKVEL